MLQICHIRILVTVAWLSVYLLQLGIFNATGQTTQQTLHTGDVGYVPKGTGHWIKSPTAEPGFMILVFNSGTFTNVDAPEWLGSLPSEASHVLYPALNYVRTYIMPPD